MGIIYAYSGNYEVAWVKDRRLQRIWKMKASFYLLDCKQDYRLLILKLNTGKSDFSLDLLFYNPHITPVKLTRTLKILLLGANIWYFGEGMMGPLFAIFSEKVGGDILDITWAWSTYLVITGLCYIIVGRIINNSPYKAGVMVFGYSMNALLTFGYLLVDSPIKLFIIQAGLGIAESLGTPAWDALYSKNLDKDLDAYAWGLSTGQSQIVTGIAFAVGGVITHFISFNALFIAMGFMQIIAALVTAQLLFIKKNI